MRVKQVAFANQGLKDAYFELKEGKFEEKQIFDFVTRAIDDLKKDSFCGIKVPKDLWPKEYIKNYQITNLWEYNLPNAWRLTYTIIGGNIKIVSMILEWMDHKTYEKRLGY